MTDAAARPPIYDADLFHLSPTWNVWCFLYAADLYALERHHDLGDSSSTYFWRNLPIRWVRVVAVVVAVDRYEAKQVLTVDDSSGQCIECFFTGPTPGMLGIAAAATAEGPAAAKRPVDGVTAVTVVGVDVVAVAVGAVVEVRGRLVEFRDQRQIRVTSLRLVPSTAHELVLWQKRTEFRRRALDGSPWLVSAAEARRHRRRLLGGAGQSASRRAAVSVHRVAVERQARRVRGAGIAGDARSAGDGDGPLAVDRRHDALGL